MDCYSIRQGTVIVREVREGLNLKWQVKGIKTINIVRRSEQVAELIKLGADFVVNSADEDVEKRVT